MAPTSRRSQLLALCLGVALAATARAEDAAPRTLPLPSSLGGHPGFFGPAPSSADLSANLRGALLMGLQDPASRALDLRWSLGASASLWRWAEAGVRFSGRWDLAGRVHQPGPVEMWLRAGPPDLGGVSLQGVLEQATARGGFDDGGRLWTVTTNVGAALAATRGRFSLHGSASYEHAGEDQGPARYDGARFGAGAWLMVVRARERLGLEIGGDALVRIGGEAGPRGPLDVAAVFAVGVRLVDENGAGFHAGYGQGFGPGMPARFGIVGIGYSYGRGYLRPAPVLPPLLPAIEQWVGEHLRQLLAPMPPPASLAPGLHRPAVPPGAAYCVMPFDLLPPPAVVHDCVVAGPPLVLSRSPLRVASFRETAQEAAWVAYQVGRGMVYGTTGAVCGIAEGLVPVFRCYDPRDPTFTLGRGLGQLGAGLAQLLIGGGGEVAGVGLDGTGVGGLVGVPVGVLSTAIVANGLWAVRGGTRLLGESTVYMMNHGPWSFDPPGPWPHQEERSTPSLPGVRSGPAMTGGGTPRQKGPVRNPRGCTGNPDHVCTVERLVDLARGEFPDRDRYLLVANKSIAKFTDGQVSRRPDVAIIDLQTRRVVKVYEAARVKNGDYVPRELLKVQEYRQAGIPVHMEPVR